jgi:hypothetical protein
MGNQKYNKEVVDLMDEDENAEKVSADTNFPTFNHLFFSVLKVPLIRQFHAVVKQEMAEVIFIIYYTSIHTITMFGLVSVA